MTNGGKTTPDQQPPQGAPNCCVIHQDDFFKVAALARGRGREVAPVKEPQGRQTLGGALGPMLHY